MRIATVVTARASWARIQTACEAWRDRGTDLHLILAGSACGGDQGSVVTDARAVTDQVTLLPGRWTDDHPEAMVQTTGHLVQECGRLFRRLVPDAVVVIADRHEVLAPAIAAAYQNIRVVHVQGGEVTGSIDDRVRPALSQLASLHCVATPLSAHRVYLQTQGRGRIVITGCPSVDLALRAAALGPLPALPEGGVGSAIDLTQPFVVLLHHADTTRWHEAGTEYGAILHALLEVGWPVVALWPNPDTGREAIAKQLRVWREHGPPVPVHAFRHVPAEAFYRLLLAAQGLVGNSSVGLRECAALGVPVVNVGTRQDGRERVRPQVQDVREADPAQIVRAMQRWPEGRHAPSPLYGRGEAGPKLAQAVLSLGGVTT